MPATDNIYELAAKYGGSNNVTEGVSIVGPNAEEKIRENGNVRTFYKRYKDGTITKQLWTELSLTDIDISSEVIDNTVDWNSL